MNAQARSTTLLPAVLAPDDDLNLSASESNPGLMLSGVGSTALVMAGFVVWNAAPATPPAITTRVFAGIVASLTLAVGHFIIFQRRFNYPHAKSLGAAVDRDLRVAPARRLEPITIAHGIGRSRAIARRTRTQDSVASHQARRWPAD